MPDPTRATTVYVVARSHAAFRTWHAENRTECYLLRYANLGILRSAPRGSEYLALDGWESRPSASLMLEAIRDRALVQKVLGPDGELTDSFAPVGYAEAPVPSGGWRIFQEYLVGQVMAAYSVTAQDIGLQPIYPAYLLSDPDALRAVYGLPPMGPIAVEGARPPGYIRDEIRRLPDATRREAPVHDTCAHVCGGDAAHVCEARAVTNLSFTLPTGAQHRMPVCQACYTSEQEGER
jgi:hypothetical protein